MSDLPAEPEQTGGQQPPQNQALRARVPDHVADGCFSTGAIVMTGPSEYIVDFLQTIGRPHRVAQRIVIPHAVMPQFIDALQKNLELYTNRFGPPPTPNQTPQDPNARRPSPQEIYDDLKMPDNVLSGTYANGVMIGHGANEFGLDFLTSFFPQSAVSSRVFLSAGQVPRLLDSLKGAVKQLGQRQLPPGQEGQPRSFGVDGEYKPGGGESSPESGGAEESGGEGRQPTDDPDGMG